MALSPVEQRIPGSAAGARWAWKYLSVGQPAATGAGDPGGPRSPVAQVSDH